VLTTEFATVQGSNHACTGIEPEDDPNAGKGKQKHNDYERNRVESIISNIKLKTGKPLSFEEFLIKESTSPQ
jgi:hypothetical protein